MSTQAYYWSGNFGKTYKYWIYRIGTSFKDEAGNYIYAKQTMPGIWRPVYIGQTSSLQTRLADHENESCVKHNGATHVHAHISSSSEAERKAEERDLIMKWEPACNEQLT
jgi:predicted GIY-YIG superfamily endonuclease